MTKNVKAKRNRITYIDAQGDQREISLSLDYDDLVVDEFRAVVKGLVRVRKYGGEPTQAEIKLQESLKPELRKKLITAKLIEGTIAERSLTLSQLIEEWFKDKTGIKAETMAVYRQYCKYLCEHFGSETLICDIEHAHAKKFIPYLMKERTVDTGILISNTVCRCIRWVKPFFESAVEDGHLAVSPFKKIKNVKYDKTQSQEHVSKERIEHAIASCRNNLEYRLIIALGGYQGLRPSEMNDLTFGDFEPCGRGIIIRVPGAGKTGTRNVPMFPEFLPLWEEALQHRKEGQEWLFAHCRKDKPSEFRNIATPIRKKIIRAGGTPWRLFFDSLRGSCITEKENSRKYTQKDMDAMFGNSEAIRQGSYIHGRTSDEEYVELAGLFGPVPAELAKKSPLISPYFGGFSGFYAHLEELVERRVMYSDLIKMQAEERGIDMELAVE